VARRVYSVKTTADFTRPYKFKNVRVGLESITPKTKRHAGNLLATKRDFTLLY
jgi:hypothetical protein